jgi:hypothetical protein
VLSRASAHSQTATQHLLPEMQQPFFKATGTLPNLRLLLSLAMQQEACPYCLLLGSPPLPQFVSTLQLVSRGDVLVRLLRGTIRVRVASPELRYLATVSQLPLLGALKGHNQYDTDQPRRTQRYYTSGIALLLGFSMADVSLGSIPVSGSRIAA